MSHNESQKQPIKVITHLLSSTRLFCDVADIPLPKDLTTDNGNYNYKLRIYINGIEIGTSSNFRFRHQDTPQIKYFEQIGGIDPSVPISGSWSDWLNNDNPVRAAASSEQETLEDFIASGGCSTPLMIQVRDSSTLAVYEEQDLIDGFNDCVCVGDAFKGLSCAVPFEDVGNYTCTKDHEVRYYCAAANVVGFALDENDDGTSMIHQPALYGSDGIKYAECLTSFTDQTSGEQIQTRPVKGEDQYVNYHWVRCQLSWSANPRIGNFRFRFSNDLDGYSSSNRNDFLGSDGQIYNFQVRARIDAITPVVGATTGGTRVTIAGVNLGGVTDMRIGGVKCTHVTASADGTSATCITARDTETCTHGDDPEDLVNCVNYVTQWSIVGTMTESSIYTRDVNGRSCRTGCYSTSTNSRPRCQLIEEISNGHSDCYVPDCQRYIKKYPGSPGIDYRWSDQNARMTHSRFATNTFMVTGLSEGDPTNFGSSINSNAYSSKLIRSKGNADLYVSESTGFFKPPLDGYYSMVVSICDDYCTFQFSKVKDKGQGIDDHF